MLIIAIVLQVISIVVHPLIGIRTPLGGTPKLIFGFICSLVSGVLYIMTLGWMALVIPLCVGIPVVVLFWGIYKCIGLDESYHPFTFVNIAMGEIDHYTKIM